MVKSCATLYESYATTAGERIQVDDHHEGQVHADQQGRGLASIADDTSTLVSCAVYTQRVVKNCATWYESHDTTAGESQGRKMGEMPFHFHFQLIKLPPLFSIFLP